MKNKQILVNSVSVIIFIVLKRNIISKCVSCIPLFINKIQSITAKVLEIGFNSAFSQHVYILTMPFSGVYTE
jgi:hypothetical protein